MKKSLLGSFVGISIIITLESLTRVIIALYMKEDVLMFTYSNYPGILWPVLITVVAGFSSFFGAMFSLTYGRKKQILTFTLFSLLLILLRYGQIHILDETESIFFPILTLILSLIALLLAWKAVRRPDKSSELYSDQAGQNEFGTTIDHEKTNDNKESLPH